MIESHLHPVLSSIPFALVTLALGAECWRASGKSGADQSRGLALLVRWNLIAGVVGVVAAFLSGYLAADFGHQTLGIEESLISTHHLWGKLLLIVGVVTVMAELVAARARFHQALFLALFRVLLVSLWFLSMITGFLGGDMLLSSRIQSNEPVVQE